jgi:hypothetical protein
VWDLRVPYNAIADVYNSWTQLLVQPSPKTWKRLVHRGLTDRALVIVPPAWSNVTGGTWGVWSPQLTRPVRLSVRPRGPLIVP